MSLSAGPDKDLFTLPEVFQGKLILIGQVFQYLF